MLSNSGSLIKNGQGTLVINGANTYSGGTTINSGLLVFGQPASIPSSGSITANAGSNLGMGVGGASSFTSDDVDALWAGTYPGVVPPAGALVAVDTAQGDFTYATSHADTRGLVKSGANTLRLTGVNTYTGGTVIQGGALTIPLTSALPGWNVDGAYAVWPDAALAVENTVTDTEVAMILGTTNFAAGACIGFDTGSGNRSYAENIGNTSQGALGLYKAGINTLSLSGANSYDGNTIVAGGILAIYNSSSLGSAAGYTRVMRAGGTSGSYYTDSTGQLQLNGSSGDIILDEDFIITGAEQYGYTGAIRNISGNNAINGRIKIENSARIASSGGRLTLNGKISGAAGSSNPMLVFSVDSREIIISNRIDIGTGQLYCHGGGTVVLAAANNFVGDVLVQYGCTLRLEANSPIAKGSPLLLGNNPEGTGKLELNGFDQEVRGLRSGGTAASLPNNLVRNSHAADESTFSVTQTAGMNEIFQGRIIDAITFIKGGANNSVLTLGGANSFSGSTIVRGGTLALDAVGTLGENCTNVVVDAGTLKLQNSAAIADTATLSLAAGGGAKVDLASGVNESVRYLFIDGEMQRCGTYGSSASAAANKNDVYFSGTGVLKVLRDNGGTVIIVR
ncbi:MAG: autotransporter-associated beta strand repeat-containing protein [Kiritimatiellae bacterium]|nr:autotransporter-associated beta strand repeat-containing protein [Kiritimatiellia bacterium]